MVLKANLELLVDEIGAEIKTLHDVWLPIGGKFGIQDNEINAYGRLSWIDNTNTQDLGNSGVTTLNRNAGGWVLPFDIKLKKMTVFHRNDNADAEAWGWVIASQSKVPASNTVTSTIILNETTDNGGVGFRNYTNIQNQQTILDLSGLANNTITADDLLILGVDCPSAGTSRNVEIFGGYILAERVS